MLPLNSIKTANHDGVEVYFTGAGLPALAQSFRSALLSLWILYRVQLHLTLDIIWHICLTLWRQSCRKMLKESRGYINWHQLRIPTSDSHPKALKAPLKYHSKVETSELLGFLASTPPHTHTTANRTSISTPRSVAIEEANDGAGRQRAQSSCPDSLWHLLAWKWALVASTSSWITDASSTPANWVGQVLDIGTETSFDCSEFLFCSTAKEYSNLMPNGLLSIDSLPSKTDWLMVSHWKLLPKHRCHLSSSSLSSSSSPWSPSFS